MGGREAFVGYEKFTWGPQCNHGQTARHRQGQRTCCIDAIWTVDEIAGWF